jgi:hypothetical protein
MGRTVSAIAVEVKMRDMAKQAGADKSGHAVYKTIQRDKRCTI